MGQYYSASILAKNKKTVEKFVSPYNYGNGAKLMEHSYIGNNFVEAVEFLLIDTGKNKNRWSGKRIVWAGDYANPEPMEGETLYSLVDKPLKILIDILEEAIKKYGDKYPLSICIPSTVLTSVSVPLASSTVMIPSLPTLSIASAMILPIASSELAEIEPT